MKGFPNSYSDFEHYLNQKQPPKEWPNALRALWYDGNENWKNAHDLVDQSNLAMDKWVHAYLHRKEGDEWNAGYWYRQADKPFPKASLKEEFEQLVNAVLSAP